MKNRIECGVRGLAMFFAVLLCLSALTDFYGKAWAKPAAEEELSARERVRMRVGSVEDVWSELDAGKKDAPFSVAEEDFAFQARQTVPDRELEKYELRMVLDECLAFRSRDAWVEDGGGRPVTKKFSVRKNGQQMIFRARESALAEGISGQTFVFCVPACPQSHIDTPHLMKDGFTYRIVNGVNAFWREPGGEEEWCSGSDVWVSGKIAAELSVEQQAPGDCRPGEIIDCSVCVRQLREDAYGIGVSVEEESLPEGLTLLGMAASGSAGKMRLKKRGKNGWSLVCPRLEYGETIIVAFQCRVADDEPTGSLENVVTVRADNFLNLKNGRDRTAADTCRIWVNGQRPSDTAFSPDR